MLQVVVHMRCGVDSVTQEDEVRRTRTRPGRTAAGQRLSRPVLRGDQWSSDQQHTTSGH